MKRANYLIVLFTLFAATSMAQVPQKFAYQAAVRNSLGQAITNQNVAIRVSLLEGSVEGSVAYSETHSVVTSSFGTVNLTIGNGGSQVGNFAEIPWSESIFIKVEIDPSGGTSFVDMGTSQLLSVPYALKAGSLAKNPIEVLAPANQNPDEPIFVVKNSAGEVVFAVYETGTRVYVDKSTAKGSRGGFAVGGIGDNLKEGFATNYLTIEPDSVRFNIKQSPVKGSRGGFAVGGIGDNLKQLPVDYLSIEPDNIRFAIDESAVVKGSRGGFAIGGIGDNNKSFNNYFYVNQDSTYVSNTLNAAGNVVIVGDMLTGGTIGTLPTAPLTDADGTIYQTIRIGNQVWMTENLRTTKYNDGTLIPVSVEINRLPYVTPVDSFSIPLTDPKWGLLYTLQLIDDTKICPLGWRLPTQFDWNALIQNSGGNEMAGAVLKDPNKWWFPVNYATNGFNIRPSGSAYIIDIVSSWEPSYTGYGANATIWSKPVDEGSGIISSSVFNLTSSNFLGEPFNYIQFNPTPSAYESFSIRCIKE